MTTAEMLARVRMFLDEATAGFWSDTHIYSALTDGQKRYASVILTQYQARLTINPDMPLPDVLLPLYTKATATLGSGVVYFAKPTDLMVDLALKITVDSVEYALLKRPISRAIVASQLNSYSSTAETYYNIDATNVNIEFYSVTPTSTDYVFHYLKKTTDIDGSTEPLLPDYTHDAICVFAFSDLLLKAKRAQDALAAFNKFLSMIEYR